MPNQELATYDPRRLTGVCVYREIERGFSVGDRIQFTSTECSGERILFDSARTLTNHTLATVFDLLATISHDQTKP